MISKVATVGDPHLVPETVGTMGVDPVIDSLRSRGPVWIGNWIAAANAGED